MVQDPQKLIGKRIFPGKAHMICPIRDRNYDSKIVQPDLLGLIAGDCELKESLGNQGFGYLSGPWSRPEA